MTLRLLALNIANPSPTRAQLQLAWLRERPEDVLVLSETKNSKGCAQLLVGLQDAGWIVVASAPGGDGYGVAVASRVTLRRDDDPLTSGPRSADLGGRALSVLLALHPATSRKSGPNGTPRRGVRSDLTAPRGAPAVGPDGAQAGMAHRVLRGAVRPRRPAAGRGRRPQCRRSRALAALPLLHRGRVRVHGLARVPAPPRRRLPARPRARHASAGRAQLGAPQRRRLPLRPCLRRRRARAPGTRLRLPPRDATEQALGPLGDVRRARAEPGPRGSSGAAARCDRPARYRPARSAHAMALRMSWWWNSNPASSSTCGSSRTEPSSSGAIGPAAGRSTIPGTVEEGRPVHEVAERLGELVVRGRLGQRDVDRPRQRRRSPRRRSPRAPSRRWWSPGSTGRPCRADRRARA